MYDMPGEPASAPPQPAYLMTAPAAPPGRRGGALVAGLVPGVIGAILALAGYVPEHAHPRSAIRHWHETIKRGDVMTLRADARLGTRAWIDGLVRELGEEEFRRVLGIYDRAAEMGREDFARMQRAARANGQAAFDALGYAQQVAVNRRSHDEWVIEAGASRVSEASAVGPWGNLLAAPSAALLQRFGTPELDADEQALLANRASNDPAVVADPMLAQLAARRDEQGSRSFSRLRAAVEREGERAFRHLGWSEREAIDARSRNDFFLQQGYSRLAEADRARLGAAQSLLDETGAVAARLGVELLSATERQAIAGRTRDEFVRQRRAFVEMNGVRLAHDLLVRSFGSSRYEVGRLVVHGVGGRDLVRRSGARAGLRWSNLGAGFRNVPAEVSMRWSSADVDWRLSEVHWRPRPDGEGGADPSTGDGEEQVGGGS